MTHRIAKFMPLLLLAAALAAAVGRVVWGDILVWGN